MWQPFCHSDIMPASLVCPTLQPLGSAPPTVSPLSCRTTTTTHLVQGRPCSFIHPSLASHTTLPPRTLILLDAPSLQDHHAPPCATTHLVHVDAAVCVNGEGAEQLPHLRFAMIGAAHAALSQVREERGSSTLRGVPLHILHATHYQYRQRGSAGSKPQPRGWSISETPPDPAPTSVSLRSHLPLFSTSSTCSCMCDAGLGEPVMQHAPHASMQPLSKSRWPFHFCLCPSSGRKLPWSGVHYNNLGVGDAPVLLGQALHERPLQLPQLLRVVVGHEGGDLGQSHLLQPVRARRAKVRRR